MMTEEVTTMADEAAATNSNEERWRAHIANARKFPGSEAEYCRRNGLKVGQFKAYKRKLGMARRYGPRKRTKRAFIKVEPSSTMPARTEAKARVPRAPMLQREVSALPDARWLARFATELVASR